MDNTEKLRCISRDVFIKHVFNIPNRPYEPFNATDSLRQKFKLLEPDIDSMVMTTAMVAKIRVPDGYEWLRRQKKVITVDDIGKVLLPQQEYRNFVSNAIYNIAEFHFRLSQMFTTVRKTDMQFGPILPDQYTEAGQTRIYPFEMHINEYFGKSFKHAFNRARIQKNLKTLENYVDIVQNFHNARERRTPMARFIAKRYGEDRRSFEQQKTKE